MISPMAGLKRRLVAARKHPAASAFSRRLPLRVRVALRPRARPFPEGEPIPVVHQRSIVIAAEPRTGSTLLATSLEAAGSFGRILEWLSPVIMANSTAQIGVPALTKANKRRQRRMRLRGRPEWARVDDVDAESLKSYLHEVVRRSTSPTGVFSIKLMWDQYQTLVEHGLDDRFPPAPASWIRITREDVVAQAVSLVRARQSDEWKREPTQSAPSIRFRYDAAALRNALELVQLQAKNWDHFFECNAIEPIATTYEELTTSYEATMRRVYRELSLEVSEIPEPKTAQQANDESRVWAQRFRDEHPDLTSEIPNSHRSGEL